MNSEDDDYVGHGHPPKRMRFQKGTSGNPAGRPRGSGKKPDLVAWNSIKSALGKTINVSTNGKTISLTKLDAVVERVTNDAINGKPAAQKLALDLILRTPQLNPTNATAHQQYDVFSAARERLAKRVNEMAVRARTADDEPGDPS